MNEQRSDVNKAQLLQGPVGETLIALAMPMAFGIVAIILFTVVDTFYIGRLGAKPLAAMGFIFPISYIVMGIAMGLSVATSSTIARAIEDGHQLQVQRLATDGLGLAFLIVTCFSLIGLTNLNTIFSLMGARGEIFKLISDYMTPWCLGVGLLVISMVSNSAIRTVGDIKTPATIMIIAGLINIVLDPFLIFGIGPFPRLELQGAALATVTSWAIAFTASLWILAKRERLVRLPIFNPKRTLDSWKQILYIGVPTAGINVMEPLSMAVIIRIISEYGEETVAAFGVGGRLEALSLIGLWVLSTAMIPFVRLNFGVGNLKRIRAAFWFGVKFSLVWGGIAFALLYLLADLIASIFSDDKAVIASLILFLRIIPISYGRYGISALVNSIFNALGKPLQASLLIMLHLFVFVLPLAYLGSKVYGLKGIFFGITVGNAAIGLIAYLMIHKFLVRLEADHESTIVETTESMSPDTSPRL